MTLVSTAIQTHPARDEMARFLRDVCLDGRADLVVDPVVGDPSPWRTYRLALERGREAPAGTTHRLIVQDDVIVCDGFLAAVEAAAAARPDRVLAFFVPAADHGHVRAINNARAQGWSWAPLGTKVWLPVVASAWPVGLIDPFLSFVDSQNYPPAFTADDEIAGAFLRASGVEPLASVPSLVEHPDTVYSIASGGRRGSDGRDATRRALVWVGDDGEVCDGRLIDWTLGPV